MTTERTVRTVGRELADLGQTVGQYLGQTARLMVGLPNYDTYVAHQRREHPGQPVMGYEAFFRERQQARYGGNGKMSRCC